MEDVDCRTRVPKCGTVTAGSAWQLASPPKIEAAVLLWRVALPEAFLEKIVWLFLF